MNPTTEGSQRYVSDNLPAPKARGSDVATPACAYIVNAFLHELATCCHARARSASKPVVNFRMGSNPTVSIFAIRTYLYQMSASLARGGGGRRAFTTQPREISGPANRLNREARAKRLLGGEARRALATGIC